MKRPISVLVILACMGMLAFPAVVSAGSRLSFGAALDGFFPMDTEMYGARMKANSWGRDMYDKSWSTGDDRVHYLTPNRESMIFSPMFFQGMTWDFGLGFEFSEQIQYLHYAPNQDVDVTYDHFMFPIRLTLKWVFNQKGKFRPFIGGGGSYSYVVSRVAGKDLYDRWRNPDYVSEDPEGDDDDDDNSSTGNDDEEKEFLSRPHEYGEDGWYPGFHGVIGADYMLRDDLGLRLSARYEVILIEAVDAELVLDGNEQWHWKERKLEGDAGGVGANFGIMYVF